MYSCFKLVSHRLSSDQSRNFVSGIVMVVSLFVMAVCLVLFTVSVMLEEEEGRERREGGGERVGEEGMGRRESGERRE